MNQTNHNVILFVVLTVCICALIGISTEAACVIWKIPDMNTQLAGGFTHVVDTVIGALIAMLINTRAQQAVPTPTQLATVPTPVTVTNTPDAPVQTHEIVTPNITMP